jgi:hypothetical protein
VSEAWLVPSRQPKERVLTRLPLLQSMQTNPRCAMPRKTLSTAATRASFAGAWCSIRGKAAITTDIPDSLFSSVVSKTKPVSRLSSIKLYVKALRVMTGIEIRMRRGRKTTCSRRDIRWCGQPLARGRLNIGVAFFCGWKSDVTLSAIGGSLNSTFFIMVDILLLFS